MKFFFLAMSLLFCLGCAQTTIPVDDDQISLEPVDALPLQEEVTETPSLLKERPFPKLDFLLLPESAGKEDCELPDLTLDSSLFKSFYKITGEKGVFWIEGILFLPQRHPLVPHPFAEKSLYFVWPEDKMTERWVSAVYSHYLLNHQEKNLGSACSYPVWHDPTNRLWFVPLCELFRHRSLDIQESLHPEDEHLLNVEFISEVGARYLLKIYFQVASALLRPHLESLELLNQQGRTYHRMICHEKISNPMTSELSLWIGTFCGDLWLSQTFLKTMDYQAQTNAPPLGPYFQWYRSEGKMRLKKLSCLYQGKVVEYELKVNEWFEIRLPPQSSLVLQWWLVPDPTTVFCQVPATQSKMYYWQTIPPLEFRHVGRVAVVPKPPQPPRLLSREVELSWHLVGRSLRGVFHREIRYAHCFIKKELVLENPVHEGFFYDVLVSSKQSMVDQQGEQHETAPLFLHQGLFP